jgi:hypothetical protein
MGREFPEGDRENVSFLNYELKNSVYYDKILQLVSKLRIRSDESIKKVLHYGRKKGTSVRNSAQR